MIDTVHIENFRCFENITLENLGRVNVVVGDSASGKTALLESIFLGSGGNPEIALRMRVFRGLGGRIPVSRTRESYEAIWRDLFFRMEQKRTIKIALTGAPENQRTLRILYDSNSTPTVIPNVEGGTGGSPTDSFSITPITFEMEDSKGVIEPIRPELTAAGLTISGTARVAPSAFYSSAFTAVTPCGEAANQFSELSKRGADGPVRKAIKNIFPDLGSLSIEYIADTYALHCIPPKGSTKGARLPVAMVSSGINKLLLLLLGIASNPMGVVLIDEIENGLYYKSLPKVWEAIRAFCVRFGVQVFITTHSRECLHAALDSVSTHEDDFRLIRTERHKDKRAVKVFTGEKFENALDNDFEIR
jgi:hypothetical protein